MLFRSGRLMALLWVGLVFSAVVYGCEGPGALPEMVTEIRLTAAGDIIMHMPIVNAYRTPEGGYDFRPIFADIAPLLQKADLATAVLETTLAGPEAKGGYTGYPMFNTPDAIVEALQWAGVDLVFTAHNHSLDRGGDGALRTIRCLNELGIGHVGLNPGPDPATRVRLVEVRGVRLAFLSYTTITNGIPSPADKPWVINRYDPALAAADIEQARRRGAEFILCALHAGTEYQRLPDESQVNAANFLLRHGVDVVLGSHPHVVEPAAYIWKQRPDGVDRKGFVIYSMGNFLSNQRWRYSDCGVIVHMVLEKRATQSGVTLKSVELQPIWVQKYTINQRTHYRIIPVNPEGLTSNDPLLTDSDRLRITEVWADTQETVGTVPVMRMSLFPLQGE
jgi:poly-gamma-glutamate capsule biosynthesis protein CapA/YwtB (metallophosphatase superfamily)